MTPKLGFAETVGLSVGLARIAVSGHITSTGCHDYLTSVVLRLVREN